MGCIQIESASSQYAQLVVMKESPATLYTARTPLIQQLTNRRGKTIHLDFTPGLYFTRSLYSHQLKSDYLDHDYSHVAFLSQAKIFLSKKYVAVHSIVSREGCFEVQAELCDFAPAFVRSDLGRVKIENRTFSARVAGESFEVWGSGPVGEVLLDVHPVLPMSRVQPCVKSLLAPLSPFAPMAGGFRLPQPIEKKQWKNQFLSLEIDERKDHSLFNESTKSSTMNSLLKKLGGFALDSSPVRERPHAVVSPLGALSQEKSQVSRRSSRRKEAVQQSEQAKIRKAPIKQKLPAPQSVLRPNSLGQFRMSEKDRPSHSLNKAEQSALQSYMSSQSWPQEPEVLVSALVNSNLGRAALNPSADLPTKRKYLQGLLVGLPNLTLAQLQSVTCELGEFLVRQQRLRDLADLVGALPIDLRTRTLGIALGRATSLLKCKELAEMIPADDATQSKVLRGISLLLQPAISLDRIARTKRFLEEYPILFHSKVADDRVFCSKFFDPSVQDSSRFELEFQTICEFKAAEHKTLQFNFLGRGWRLLVIAEGQTRTLLVQLLHNDAPLPFSSVLFRVVFQSAGKKSFVSTFNSFIEMEMVLLFHGSLGEQNVRLEGCPFHVHSALLMTISQDLNSLVLQESSDRCVITNISASLQALPAFDLFCLLKPSRARKSHQKKVLLLVAQLVRDNDLPFFINNLGLVQELPFGELYSIEGNQKLAKCEAFRRIVKRAVRYSEGSLLSQPTGSLGPRSERRRVHFDAEERTPGEQQKGSCTIF